MSASDSASTGLRAGADEVALLRRIAKGDQLALARFYDLHIDAVYRFVYHQVGGHREDAEDVTQDTFITAIDNLESFRGESRLYVWLCGIAWRKASDFRRRRDHARTPQPASEDALLDLPVASAPATVEEMAERDLLRDHVWQALLALPDHYRQVLTLKYIEEFEVSEIALLTSKTEKAVESLLTRARHSLRAQLNRETESGD